MRIVIAEYPKSGGTWICSLVGDALSLPKRDIYVCPEYKSYDFWKHPWYRNASDLRVPKACVIKSHELPQSTLHNFPNHLVHLVRDGRDVVISKYFFESDFCVANGVYSEFGEPFDDYVSRVSAEWNQYVRAWMNAGIPYVRYEEFLADPIVALKHLLSLLGYTAPQRALASAVEKNTKEKLHAALSETFEHNTFVRRGSAGDWRNYFQKRHVDIFANAAGEAMERLGYCMSLEPRD